MPRLPNLPRTATPDCSYWRQRGFTLTELLITLAIGSIVIGIAIPSFGELLQKEQRTRNTNTLVGALHFTQQQAVFSGSRAVICPTSDRLSCDKNWGSHELLVFKDNNSNGTLETDEDETLQLISVDEGWSIRWRAFGNRKRIEYLPTGYIFNQNGTMELCPDKATDEIAIIVVNRIGRLRQELRALEDSKCRA